MCLWYLGYFDYLNVQIGHLESIIAEHLKEKVLVAVLFLECLIATTQTRRHVLSLRLQYSQSTVIRIQCRKSTMQDPNRGQLIIPGSQEAEREERSHYRNMLVLVMPK